MSSTEASPAAAEGQQQLGHKINSPASSDPTNSTSEASRSPPQGAFERQQAKRCSFVLLKRRPNEGQRAKEFDMAPLFNAGASFFADLRRGKVIADKTLFLRTLFASPGTALRITLPRGMGKSLLLSMVREFAALPAPGEQLEARKALFTDTKIWTDELFVNRHFAKHPVIHIDLNNVCGITLSEVLTKYREMLRAVVRTAQFRDVFDQYAQRRANGTLGMDEHLFDFLESARAGGTDLERHELSGSIGRLSEILSLHHGGARVIILVDEYEKPVGNLHTLWDSEEEEQIVEFHRQLLNHAFKDNEWMLHGIAAGVFQLAEYPCSGLRFQVECTLLERENDLLPFFGFDEWDVEELRQKLDEEYGLKLPKGHWLTVKRWYNGYAYTEGIQQVNVYNPWSMSKFLREYSKQAAKCGRNEVPRIDGFLRGYWTKNLKLQELVRMLRDERVGVQLEEVLREGEEEEQQQQAQRTRRSTRLAKGLRQTMSALQIGHKKSDPSPLSIGAPLREFGLDEFRELASAAREMDNLRMGDADLAKLLHKLFSYLCHVGLLKFDEDKRLYMSANHEFSPPDQPDGRLLRARLCVQSCVRR